MSFIHLIFIGDFERDAEWIRYANTPDNPILKPVVRRPIDGFLIRQLVAQSTIDPKGEVFPPSWDLWLEDGYLAAERYHLSVEAIGFIASLVAEGEYQVVDDRSHLAISVFELTPMPHRPPPGSAASPLRSVS